MFKELPEGLEREVEDVVLEHINDAYDSVVDVFEAHGLEPKSDRHFDQIYKYMREVMKGELDV